MKKRKYISPKTAPSAVFASMEDFMPIIEERLAAGHSVELSPRGVSMLPLIREGKDSVILSPTGGKLKKYDLPLYLRRDGKYVLHRVVAIKDDGYTMAGDNQYVYERGISHDQIIAVVSAIRRGGRLFFAANPLYRLYVVFWHHTRSLRHFAVRVVRRIKKLFI